ncbi:hypothetical protein [Streptomyces sp. NBC_00887]|uniref:hypothetical protein n=1 Tax=Streptomyces sp. NBC_00887 TaxID=2975859 RepID=UPI003866E960|nr:hypothetical protein OG844_06535 [Streptomyces sp. NBC_00887]WSY35289.1 hypothetical protein OG844_39065 [Streptomyces sp. NBC_00887]
MTDTDRTGDPGASPVPAGPKPQFELGTGPGRVLVWFYGVFTVAAASRSIVQMILDFDKAPLAYVLSAVAAVVYGFITYSLVRGGEKARRAALVCCAAELAGVLVIGTWTLLEPSAFPDATVWSDFGMGYLFIPVILPVTGMIWLRRARNA